MASAGTRVDELRTIGKATHIAALPARAGAVEERLHIHVQSADGEAKFWIEPEIELARNHQLSPQDLSRVLELIVEHEQEIRDAWHRHFGR